MIKNNSLHKKKQLEKAKEFYDNISHFNHNNKHICKNNFFDNLKAQK